MPASVGVQGPGESTIASGRSASASAARERVVPAHLADGAEIAQVVDEVEGEAVVVVDQQDHAAFL